MGRQSRLQPEQTRDDPVATAEKDWIDSEQRRSYFPWPNS